MSHNPRYFLKFFFLKFWKQDNNIKMKRSPHTHPQRDSQSINVYEVCDGAKVKIQISKKDHIDLI